MVYLLTEHVVVTKTMPFVWCSSCAGPTSDSCYDEATTIQPSTSTTASGSTTTTTSSVTPSPTAAPPTKVVGVRVTPGVQNTSPTLTIVWQALAWGAVTYTVKYSTQPGEVNTPPVRALEVGGISGTSTILTALERGTTYYIWVVGVSEGGEGPHSDRMSGVTYDGELDGTSGTSLSKGLEWMYQNHTLLLDLLQSLYCTIYICEKLVVKQLSSCLEVILMVYWWSCVSPTPFADCIHCSKLDAAQ